MADGEYVGLYVKLKKISQPSLLYAKFIEVRKLPLDRSCARLGCHPNTDIIRKHSMVQYDGPAQENMASQTS